jgi:toxin ParE1/3/4
MGERVTRQPEVRRNLIEQAGYISHDNLDAALRFLDAAEATFEFLADHREVGEMFPSTNPRTAGMRVWPVDGFRNHLVFYRPTDDGVDIVRVLHGSRDLGAVFGVGD